MHVIDNATYQTMLAYIRATQKIMPLLLGCLAAQDAALLNCQPARERYSWREQQSKRLKNTLEEWHAFILTARTVFTHAGLDLTEGKKKA